jgi:long-chain fatty acid transport protein
MKKLLVFLCVAGLIAASASPLFAGGIDNKTNWSAEYIRTLNRNAATDSADIVAYNPAGVMKMENGLFGNLSVQYINKDYTNKVDGTDYDSTEPSFLPGLFALYKQDKWAGFFAFTIPGGGGFVDFKDGNYITTVGGALINLTADRTMDATLQGMGFPAAPLGTYYGTIASQQMEAESYYYGFTIGGAYKINDMFSVSLGARYIDAHREAKGSVTVSPTATGAALGATNIPGNVDYEEDADGWGGIIGVNIAPSSELNIGLRYETKTSLDFDQKVNTDNLGLLPSLGVNDGASVSRDLPATLGLGLSYKFTPKIRVETNFTLYLNSDAGWTDTAPTSRDPSDVDNGYDIGIAVEYTFNNKLKGSLGYLHTDTGIEAKNMESLNPELNANTIGAGVAYEAMPGMMLNFSLGNAFYEDDSFVSQETGDTVEYQKNNFFLSFGIQYKFM